MSFFSNLWGGGDKKDQSAQAQPTSTPATTSTATAAATAAAEQPKPAFVPQVPTYGEAKPQAQPAPPRQSSQPQSSNNQPNDDTAHTTTTNNNNTNTVNSTPNKPMFKGLAFKAKVKTDTQQPPTPTHTSSTSTTPSTNSLAQNATKKPTAAAGGGGGLMALMKKTPAQPQQQTIQSNIQPKKQEQPQTEKSDMNSFLDSDEDEKIPVHSQSVPTDTAVTQNNDNDDGDESGFAFMSDDTPEAALEDEKVVKEEPVEKQQQQQQQPARTGFAALIKRNNLMMVKSPAQLQQQHETIQANTHQSNNTNNSTNNTITDHVTDEHEDDDGADDEVLNSSSPLVYKNKSISQYDKLFYSTTQEITLHLPTYHDLYTKLNQYQTEYMSVLSKLASNTEKLQVDQKKMQTALENDQFEEAAQLDAEIESLQVDGTRLNQEIKAKNELILAQQDLLEKMLSMTNTDNESFQSLLSSSSSSSNNDNNDDNNTTNTNNNNVDITADYTTIMPLTYIHSEYIQFYQLNTKLIQQHQKHLNTLKTTLETERMGLINENDETKTTLVTMEENIVNFVENAKKAKLEMLEQHDIYTTTISTLEEEIVELEAKLAAKRENLTQQQEALSDLGTKLLSYDESSKQEHLDLQTEYEQLGEYQVDLTQRIESYNNDLSNVDTFISTQCPKNETIVQSQSEQHSFVLQTFVNGYNQRQQQLQKSILFSHFDKNLFTHKAAITTILADLQSSLDSIVDQQGELLTIQSAETTCLKEIADIDQILPLLQAEKKQAITMKAFDKAGAITTQHNLCMTNKSTKEDLLVTLRQQQDDLNIKIAELESQRDEIGNKLIAQIQQSASSSSSSTRGDGDNDDTSSTPHVLPQLVKNMLLSLLKSCQHDQALLKRYLQDVRGKLNKELDNVTDNKTDNNNNNITTIQPQFFTQDLISSSSHGKQIHSDHLQQLHTHFKINKVWQFGYSPITLQSLLMLLEVEGGEFTRLAKSTGCDLKSLSMIDPFKPEPLNLPEPKLSPLIEIDTTKIASDDDEVDGQEQTEEEQQQQQQSEEEEEQQDVGSEAETTEAAEEKETEEEEEEDNQVVVPQDESVDTEELSEDNDEAEGNQQLVENQDSNVLDENQDQVEPIDEQTNNHELEDNVENEHAVTEEQSNQAEEDLSQEEQPADGEVEDENVPLEEDLAQEETQDNKEEQGGFDFMQDDEDADDDNNNNDDVDEPLQEQDDDNNDVQSGFAFMADGDDNENENAANNQVIEDDTVEPIESETVQQEHGDEGEQTGFDFMTGGDDDVEQSENVDVEAHVQNQPEEITPFTQDANQEVEEEVKEEESGFDFMGGDDDNHADDGENTNMTESNPQSNSNDIDLDAFMLSPQSPSQQQETNDDNGEDVLASFLSSPISNNGNNNDTIDSFAFLNDMSSSDPNTTNTTNNEEDDNSAFDFM